MIRIVEIESVTPPKYTVLGSEVVEIEETVRELTAQGVVFHRYSHCKQDDLGIWDAPGGARVAWFSDPDGNVLSVSQHPGTP